VLLAHLSDLHLRDDDDVIAFEKQLDRIVAREPAHTVITGDLLDRWDPPLLARALDALGDRGLLDANRLTILHGNHDLASSGGHPRRTADLWRLVIRSWDPPPLVAARRRRFYTLINRRAPNVGVQGPFVKQLANGWRVATIDTIPIPWRPLRIRESTVIVQHAVGCVRRGDADWLSSLGSDASPLLLLAHHFPLDPPEFHWKPNGRLRHVIREVRVPMAIPDAQRTGLLEAAAAAQVRLLLCGHVHRARLAFHGDVAIGLNGQSGADWAGRTIAYYDLGEETVTQVTRSISQC
jgi:3',5'-cyclic AMP phosphodiesterase CpdA